MPTDEKQLNSNYRSGYMFFTCIISKATKPWMETLDVNAQQIVCLWKKEQKNMLKGDMKGPLTVWQSLNEIIPVFIWVTSNYAASIKPLWPHILAPTPHPHKNMCTRTHTQTRLRAHTCPLQTLSGFVHDTVFHKYLQAHMHFIVFAHDCRSYVNINGNPQDVSQSALATLTHSYT